MKLTAREGNEKLQAPDIILGATADAYVSYDWHTHTFRTYDKAHWVVEDYGAALGSQVVLTVDQIDQ